MTTNSKKLMKSFQWVSNPRTLKDELYTMKSKFLEELSDGVYYIKNNPEGRKYIGSFFEDSQGTKYYYELVMDFKIVFMKEGM